jgi:multidrug efflux pump subunit AcrA (membrane-fusion protein)
MRIVDLERIEIELIAPSRWLGWLAVGDSFVFRVDETAMPLNATIVRLGGVVDPVSQTVKVFGVLETRDGRVRPGMSGTAVFPRAGG